MPSTLAQIKPTKCTHRFREIFFNETGQPYKTGDVMRRPKLARTLRRTAQGGADEFYTGALAADIVADLIDLGLSDCNLLCLLNQCFYVYASMTTTLRMILVTQKHHYTHTESL